MASHRPSVVDGLDVNQVSDGLIVYDPDRDRVHYLNNTAAAIFTLCDGAREVRAIVEALGTVFGEDAPSLTEVEACVAQLEDEGMLRSGS
jgi:hypothetical protein